MTASNVTLITELLFMTDNFGKTPQAWGSSSL